MLPVEMSGERAGQIIRHIEKTPYVWFVTVMGLLSRMIEDDLTVKEVFDLAIEEGSPEQHNFFRFARHYLCDPKHIEHFNQKFGINIETGYKEDEIDIIRDDQETEYIEDTFDGSPVIVKGFVNHIRKRGLTIQKALGILLNDEFTNEQQLKDYKSIAEYLRNPEHAEFFGIESSSQSEK